MARSLTAALVALVVTASLVASAMSETPECCKDYHKWGNELEKTCDDEEQSDNDCNAWCMQSSCSRDGKDGWCKKIGKLHYCHCKC
nr:defensin-like protein 22 [Lolium perenne]